jgi:hypothetical protein
MVGFHRGYYMIARVWYFCCVLIALVATSLIHWTGLIMRLQQHCRVIVTGLHAASTWIALKIIFISIKYGNYNFVTVGAYQTNTSVHIVKFNLLYKIWLSYLQSLLLWLYKYVQSGKTKPHEKKKMELWIHCTNVNWLKILYRNCCMT